MKNKNIAKFIFSILTISLVINFIACKNNKVENKSLFVITVNDKDGCIDSLGNIIIEPNFFALNKSSIGEGLIGFLEDKKWGYIDYSGKIIIKPKFQSCNKFVNGMARVEDDNKKYGFINKNGDWVIEPIYDWTSNFSNGLAIVKINYVDRTDKIVVDMNDELVGLINTKGEMVVPVKYVYIHGTPGFTEDLIVLADQDLHSFVFSKEGKFLYSKNYVVGKFGNGLGRCNVPFDKRVFFIDKSGNEKFRVGENISQVHNFSEGLASCEISNKWGFIDTTGIEIIRASYDNASDFSNGLAKVKVGEKYGFIDKKGNVVIQAVYDDADDFENSLSYVKIGKKEGYINMLNKWIWKNFQD